MRISIVAMYVCLCKGITDGQIRQAIADGADSLKEVSSLLGTATQCGKCGTLTRDIVRNELQAKRNFSEELFYSAID